MPPPPQQGAVSPGLDNIPEEAEAGKARVRTGLALGHVGGRNAPGQTVVAVGLESPLLTGTLQPWPPQTTFPVNQLYIHIYPLFFRFFSHISHHRVLIEFSVL